MNKIKTKLANAYGVVEIWEKENKYYIGLDNYMGYKKIEISRELYDLIKKELSR